MNKKNVKIFTFISLIFVTLLIIGGVSAAVDDNQVATTDDDTITSDAVTASNDVQKTNEIRKEDAQIKSAQLQYNANDYADIKSDIADIEQQGTANDDGQIDLTAGTTYSIDESISWGSDTSEVKTLTINGNGATIDGSNTYQFMTVNEGFTLNLNDLTIKNTISDKGSAIANYGTLNLNNVNFTDNVAQKPTTGLAAGAAIYNEGTTTVTDSTFTNNRIIGGVNGDDGATIHTRGALYVYNSKFDSNIGEYTDTSSSSNGANGGAIAVVNSISDFIVDNCTFTNNKGRHGGAILVYDSQGRNQGTKKITGSTFTGNQAIYGGAIETYNDLIIEDSTFEENSVKGIGSGNRNPLGGAICVNNMVLDGTAGSLSLKNVTFTKNTAPEASTAESLQGYGGAIYNSGPDSTIDNCTFTENSAYYGGAYYANTNRTECMDVTITNSNFVENTAHDGAAIWDKHYQSSTTPSSMTIEDCQFKDNVATYSYGSTIKGDYSNLVVRDTNISDSNKYAINLHMSELTKSMSNVTINGLGNINSLQTMIPTVTVTDYAQLVAVSKQINNDYTGTAAVTISLEGTDYTETEPIVFENNTCTVTINGNGKTIDANGMQFLTVAEGKTVQLNNLTIANAKSDKGAAVINHGTLTVNNCVFEDNQALYYGGAIYSDGTKLTVKKSNFTNNQVTTHQAAGRNDYGGGAICALGELSVETSNFVENIAAHNDVEPNGDGGVAGAILVLNNTNTISIKTSNFTNNEARHGGAITINNNDKVNTKKVTIDKNNFVENTALYGGAIDTYQQVNITNNNFTKNTVKGQGSGNRLSMGGAIVLNTGNSAYTAIVTNNTFKENEAQEKGSSGVLLTMPGTTLTSSNNVYEDNTAYDTGVATIQGSATFTNDTFTGNEGTAYTGVFTQVGDELTISNCTFENNNGNGYGDIAYAYEGYDVTITDSTIITENEFGDLMSPANSDDFEGTNVKVNGVTFAYTDFKDPIVFDVADYQELVNLVATIKSEQIAFNVVANLIGTDYNETEPIILDDTFPAESFTIEGNGKTIDAAGMQFLTVGEGQTVTINNLTVANAKADNGAAIINHGDLTINDAVFEDNQAVYRGGAILTDGTLTVTKTKFTNNQVTTSQGAGSKDYGGGAICAFGELTVDESVFTANVAAHNDVEPNGDGGVAGAILVLNNSEDITIINSNFTENTGRHGGAITINDNLHRDEGTVTIDSNNFVNNDALYGGAIDTYHSAVITNNNFTDNWIDGQGSGDRTPMGGAICLNKASSDPAYTITLENNKFSGNEAKDNGHGGAIFTMGDTTLSSNNNTFEDNTATSMGGAIYNQGTFTSTDDTFNNNNAFQAGTILNLGTTTLTDDTFTENTADYVGTIFNNIEDLTITNCTFTNNKETAVNWAGDLIYTNGNVILTDSTINTDKDTELIAVRNNAIVTASENTINNTVIAKGLVLTTIDDLTITEVINGENITVVVKATSDDSIVTTGTVELYVGDTPISSNCTADDNGFNVTVNTNLYGDNEVTIKYSDVSGVYVSSEKTVDLTIDKKAAIITVDDVDDAVATDATAIPFTVTSGDEILTQGTVTLKVVNENGEALLGTPDQTIDLSSTDEPIFTVTLFEGTYYYNLSYADDDYAADNVTVTVTASKLEAYLAADDEEGFFGEDIAVTISVADEEDEAVTQGTLSFVDEEGNDVIDPVTITGDETVVTFNFPLAGQYDITIKYTDDKYTASDWDLTITVFAKEAEINPTVSPTPIYVDNAITITANVTDEDDEIVTVGKLVLTKDDEVVDECELTTGTATFNIAAYTEAAEETYVLKYVGSENYEVEDAEVIVTVIQVPATINAENIPDAIATEETNIPFTITHADELVMQGTATITKVDENGQYIADITTIDLANDDTTFTITPAEGTYYYNISLTDNKYTADNVTITVTTNKITVTMDTEFDEYTDVFGKDINVIVTIKDAEENPITQGTITVYETDELVQTVEVTGDETVITFNYPEAGAHTLVLKYSDDKYTADDKEIVVLAEAKEAFIISEDVDAFVGDNVVITASVECDGVEVTEGQIRFTNSNGEVLAVCDLSDGPATYDYGVVDEEFDDEVTVEFINSDNYYSDGNFIFVEVIKKYADIELTTSEAKVGSPVTVTASVSYEDEALTEGQIVFTDEDGNEIDTVDIADGVATTTVQYDTVGTYTVYAKIISPTYDGEDSIDITIEKIPVTISVIDDQTVAVGDTVTVTATISSDNAIVNGGKVVFTKGSTILAEVDVTEGSASFDYRPTTSGETTITAKYIPSEIYSIEEDAASCVITAERIATTTTLDEVTLVAGKTVTLTARITADDDSIVDTGKVAFKVNGKTLKDSNGKVIYVKVVNGVASLDYTVSDSLLGKDVSIEAVYSGSNKYVNSKDKDSELSVMSGVADIEITSPGTVTKGQIATFTVKVTDNNVNVNEGKVILKINGKTLKNTEGKVIYAPVVDGIAMVEYLIPDTMKSKDYTLSAVFVSSNYSRCVDEQTLTVQ